mmetsp:Transcript_38667/g.48846  ORF Transcript_38667/g.48846 Transcript_38667/m.48846 type:complete len:723 (-) Transcript_38667:107-2275(-)
MLNMDESKSSNYSDPVERISGTSSQNLRNFSSHGQGKFQVGARVEVDWDKTGSFSSWSRTKGFIASIVGGGNYEVVRDEDLVSAYFLSIYIRPLDMDVEGFHIAAGHGYLHVVKHWIENGGDPNSKFKGFTALHLACEMGQLEVIRYLVEDVGVDYQIGHDHYGVRPFDMAFVSGNVNAIRYAVQALAKEKGSDNLDIARHFVGTFENFNTDISLSNVNLLRASTLAKLVRERYPSYETCLDADLHVPASHLMEGDEVLYLCHRWESRADPDPDGRQFQLLKEFLQSEDGSAIKYVFIDYSCVLQDKTSSEYHCQIKNLATAAIVSTHCLVLPDIAEIETVAEVGIDYLGMNTKIVVYPITHLSDLMSRAWCKFEIISCLITGSKIFCHYYLERHVNDFFLVPEGAIRGKNGKLVEGGFSAASVLAVDQISTRDKELVKKVSKSAWGIEEGTKPNDIIKDLVYAVMAFTQDKETMIKIAKLEMQTEELMERTFHDATEEQTLNRVSDSFGALTCEADRIYLMRSMLQLLTFCMDKVPLTKQQKEEVFLKVEDAKPSVVSKLLRNNSPRKSTQADGSPRGVNSPLQSIKFFEEGSLKNWLVPLRERARTRSEAAEKNKQHQSDVTYRTGGLFKEEEDDDSVSESRESVDEVVEDPDASRTGKSSKAAKKRIKGKLAPLCGDYEDEREGTIGHVFSAVKEQLPNKEVLQQSLAEIKLRTSSQSA